MPSGVWGYSLACSGLHMTEFQIAKGQLYVECDRRENSLDSRTLGTISRDLVRSVYLYKVCGRWFTVFIDRLFDATLSASLTCFFISPNIFWRRFGRCLLDFCPRASFAHSKSKGLVRKYICFLRTHLKCLYWLICVLKIVGGLHSVKVWMHRIRPGKWPLALDSNL